MNRAQRRAAQHQRHTLQEVHSAALAEARRCATPMRLVSMCSPYSESDLMRFLLPTREAFERMRNGQGAEADFHELGSVANVVIVRGQAIDPQVVAVGERGADALRRTWDRAQRTGRWGFDGPALADVEECIELHEQLARLSTPKQMHEAMLEVIRLCQQATNETTNQGVNHGC